MDALERILVPHALRIAQIAAAVTMLQILSPVFLLYDIRKKGTSNDYSTAPFLGGIVLSLLNLRYGTLLRDDAMTKVNLFGFTISVIYMCAYYFYTPGNRKTKVWIQIGLTGLLSIACIAYSVYEDSKLVEYRFGMIVTLFLILLSLSSYLCLGEVIRKQCTKSLPLPIIISGVIVAFSWLLYGVAIKNHILVLQNSILVLINFIPLSLCLVYPREPAAKRKKQKKAKAQ